MIKINRMLHEQIRSCGSDAYNKLLVSEMRNQWGEIVDESIAAQVTPVDIEHSVLFVDVKNSSFKDQLKFYKEEIIESINESFNEEEPLIKDVRLANAFQIANMPPKKIEPAQEKKFKVSIEEIEVTDEEKKHCEEQVAKFHNDELRQKALELLSSHVRSQKFKLANGWHKCKNCDVLCPPEEIFCEVCKIKEREAMIEELYRIFYDAPQTKTHEAQKLLLERMPYMRDKCFPEVIESARTSLIQKIANKVRFGDEDSEESRILVALEKQLPLDKVTPAIVKRTMLDMQFNLADQLLIRRYNYIKSIRK